MFVCKICYYLEKSHVKTWNHSIINDPTTEPSSMPIFQIDWKYMCAWKGRVRNIIGNMNPSISYVHYILKFGQEKNWEKF